MTAARLSFAHKAIAAFALVAIADWLFYGQEPGWTLGLFALAWVVALAAAVPAVRSGTPALALAAAALFGLVLIDDPSPLAWTMFGVAIGSAALLTRRRFDDALTWGLRLATMGLIGLVAPMLDARRLARHRPASGGAARTASLLVLPAVGTAVFLALFALANPIIGHALGAIRLPGLGTVILHLILWGFVLAMVWPSFRPRAAWLTGGIEGLAVAHAPLPVASLLLSLVAFNLVFALQNALDIAFLWSGAALPDGVSVADYARRGAHTLVATALLAGAFVLVAFRRGSPAAQSRLVRRLVMVWIAQNVFLVASSILRTLDYIQSSMLTVMRISALAWMGLVALGLVLVCWRVIAGRSTAWLVNANAAAALAVLTVASVVDLGATAAAWNVRHTRDPAKMDLCYMEQLGTSALLPLTELEGRVRGSALHERIRFLRMQAHGRLAEQQADWHRWTWRGARRLAEANRLTGGRLIPLGDARRCGGEPYPPAVAPAPSPTPLTKGSAQ